MAPRGFLDTDANIAIRQIWSRLPGNYTVQRQSHHDQVIRGACYDHRDITIPATGVSQISARPPTDSEYDGELLQTSTFNVKAYDGNQETKKEARVFRNKDGQISVWSVLQDSNHTVTFKLTDLRMRHEIRDPYRIQSGFHQEAGVESVEDLWVDQHGKNDLNFDFIMGGLCHYQMRHMLIKGPDEWTMQHDDYFPLPGGFMV